MNQEILNQKNTQRLVPVFYKNPNRPIARLLKQINRQNNFIKTTSHSKYDKQIEKLTKKKLPPIKSHPTSDDILINIIDQLGKDFESTQLIWKSKKQYVEKHDKLITFHTLISRLHNEQAEKNKQINSNFPILQYDSSYDSDRVTSIISACTKQSDQLEKMHKFVHQKQRNQRKRFASLHEQIGLLYLLE